MKPICLLILTITLTAPLLSQYDEGRRRPPRPPHPMTALLHGADIDENGVVSAAEWSRLLDQLPVDAQGGISQDAFRELLHGLRDDRRPPPPTDQDAAPNQEGDANAQRPQRRRGPKGRHGDRDGGRGGLNLDSNGDGVFAVDDLELMFARADQNGDGAVTREEMHAAHPKRRHRRP